jgi:Uma2 family endonuclease
MRKNQELIRYHAVHIMYHVSRFTHYASRIMTTQAVPITKKRSDTTPSLTGEALFERGDNGRAELVEGKLIRMSPTGYSHGWIENNFGGVLRNFVEQHNLGRVLTGEVGIYTRRDPDSVRGADVVYISNERFSQVQSKSYLDVAPELIVEVLSPDDRWTDVMEKLAEYFAIGVQVVWIADPKHQQIFVYHSLTENELFTADDELSGEPALPGFKAPVSAFF